MKTSNELGDKMRLVDKINNHISKFSSIYVIVNGLITVIFIFVVCFKLASQIHSSHRNVVYAKDHFSIQRK